MSIPPDPNDPTRADLPPVPGEATRPLTTPGDLGGSTPIPPERPLPPGRPSPADDRDDGRRAAWLWALLALVLIGIVLFALLRANDDDDEVDATAETATETSVAPPEDTAPETSAPDDAAADPGAATTAPAPETSAPATDEAAGGSEASDLGTALTADGTDLLGLVEGDAGDAERLAPHVDQDVTGSRVEVLEVVEGEGFWIGIDEQRRIFAHAAAGSTAEVAVGQRIDFDGFLKANPPADSADVHDIPEDQGAELHRQQGHHLELRSFTVAS